MIINVKKSLGIDCDYGLMDVRVPVMPGFCRIYIDMPEILKGVAMRFM